MNATATSVLRTTPWQHQRDAVAFVADLYARGKRGAMIAAAMGTGKSAMTVYLCAEQGFRLILIVCPLRVVQVWKPQFAAHTTTPFEVIPLDDSFAGVRAKQVEAERQLKLAHVRGVPAVVVINYRVHQGKAQNPERQDDDRGVRGIPSRYGNYRKFGSRWFAST